MPRGSVDCGAYYCGPGKVCMRGGRCGPRGSVDCGGYFCLHGEECVRGGRCMPRGATNCGDGGYCPPAQVCKRGGGCMPRGHVECGAISCRPGYVCARGVGCMPRGATYCGGTQYCPPGQVCKRGGGCMPRGAVECGDDYCHPGWVCMRGGGCMPRGNVDCGGGRNCSPGYVCKRGGGCMPRGAVECGDSYCRASEFCGQDRECLPLTSETTPQIAELVATTNRLMEWVPPPIPEKDLSLEWTTLLGKKDQERLILALDLLVLSWELRGTIGGKILPNAQLFLVIPAKSLIAGADAAQVYVSERNTLADKALQYLKEPETARRFAYLLQNLKEGNPISSQDADMLPAARALLAGNTTIFWDAMLSSQARAAMVRAAAIEAGLAMVSEGTGGILKDLTWGRNARELFEEALNERKKAKALLKGANAADSEAIRDVITKNNEFISKLYWYETPDVATFLQEIALPDLLLKEIEQ